MAIDGTSYGLIGNRLYQDFNITAPGANTKIITTNLTLSSSCTALRVTVALTTASVFNVTAYNGTTTHKWGLNESNALQAADLYSFAFPACYADSSSNAIQYNFEVETDGVVEVLVVDEIIGGQI